MNFYCKKCNSRLEITYILTYPRHIKLYCLNCNKVMTIRENIKIIVDFDKKSVSFTDYTKGGTNVSTN